MTILIDKWNYYTLYLVWEFNHWQWDFGQSEERLPAEEKYLPVHTHLHYHVGFDSTF